MFSYQGKNQFLKKLNKGDFLMRSIVKLFWVLSILFLFSSQAIASDSYINNSAEKFSSGVANAVTGWVELPKNIILTSQKEGPAYGITVGLAMGIMHTVGRSLVGVLDAATFFIPTKPSVNPPYIWQDFSRETSY
ncbi:exosortase system-associated protein, TIGR04073 family [Nitrosomonas sp. Is35]|uniref:exosortase system-associated protein, TIGR04073 family n=2 Tax=unclassified Nitrosomonas TaxID=2609265 RepID=UPI0039819F5A